FSENLSVFWKRWHMTFSNFLFAYVFKPSLSLLNRLFPRFPRMSITVTGYLFTFFICGLWHGDAINFVYWGLWHGVGLSIGKLWKVYIKLPDRVLRNNIYKIGSILLTFLFVTIGWMFFQYSQEQIIEIFNTLLF
ncbi:MAG: hypothetical protein HQ565_05410, partial [Bacteroidetes bacterium]|nr:hypothetical protein [Bacteroidota bacterium]